MNTGLLIVVIIGFVALALVIVATTNSKLSSDEKTRNVLHGLHETLKPKEKLKLKPASGPWTPLKVDWRMIRRAVKRLDFSSIDWTLRPGECCAGEGNEVVHPTGFITLKKLALDGLIVAFIRATVGHIPMLALRTINMLAKPLTVYMNEVTIEGGRQAVQNCGPVQSAIADAVRDCVAIGLLPEDKAEELALVIDSFTHWMACGDDRIYNYTYYAIVMMIYRAVTGYPTVGEINQSAEPHPYAGTKQYPLVDVAAIDKQIKEEDAQKKT